MISPARGPLLRTSRLTRTAALTLGTLALGTAVAPAAWADDAAATTTESAPSSTASTTPEVLTPTTTEAAPATTDAPGTTSAAPTTAAGTSASTSSSQVAASTTTPTGAHFGTGKLALGLTSDALPTGQTLNPAGAQLEIRFSQVRGLPSTITATCDFITTSCTFPTGSAIPVQQGYDSRDYPSLPADSIFTLTLVHPPTSGQLLAAPVSIQGWTDTTPASSSSDYSDLALPVLHGYRQLGVTVVDGAPAGTQVALCRAVAGACDPASSVSKTTDAAGLATFPGRYLPGAYLVTRSGTSTPFTVPAATSTTERDTPLRLTLGVPVATPPTTASPTATPTASVAAPSLALGRQQTVTLGGFTPGETVRGTLYSTPVDLGTAVADARGVATFTFTVPAGLELGVHTVTAAGLTSGVTTSATFTVVATPALAQTGVEVWPLLGLGALALGGGAALTAAGGRRRRQA